MSNHLDTLMGSFIESLDDDTAFLVNAIIAKIGGEAFIENACHVETRDSKITYGFKGFMEEAERIDFFQKYYGNIEQFLSDEADLEDINMICRVEQARRFFPQEVPSNRPIPNDINFSQGDLYELFLDNDTDHQHYNVLASSIALDVVDTIANKFTAYTKKADVTENEADSAPVKDGYDKGYADGYAQAKKDVIAALSSN